MMRNTLTIKKSSWHGRVYCWWDRNWQMRKEYAAPRVQRPGTENLCHYMRVILIWAPIWWFLCAKRTKYVRPWSVFLAVAFPIGMYVWATLDFHNFIWSWFEIFICVLTVSIAVGSIVVGLTIKEKMDDKKKMEPDKGPSFFKVSSEYVKTRKAKICPFIKIEQ